MKRLSCVTLLGASLFMFSCGDDAPSADEYALPEKFSSKTTEQNKAQLEDNGIKLLKSLEGLRDSKGIETSVSLLNLFNSSEETEAAPGGRILSSMANLRTDSNSASKVFSAMRLKGENSEEDPETIQELIDAHAGTYTWKAAASEWDTVATGGTSVIYKFPAVEGGTTNNAILTIGDYQGETATFEGESVELPKNLTMNITVDGAKVVDYSFKATYNGSQDPTSMVSTLTLAPYVFEVKFSNTTTAIESNYSLRNGAETMLAMGASSTGKYSIDAIETTSEEDLVEKASAYFQIYNIKIAGSVDAKSIVAGLDEIEKAGLTSDQEAQKEAELFNEHYNLMVFYVDSMEKVADTEFYNYSDTYTDYEAIDTDGDGYPDSYQPVERTELETDMRFVFADGSKSDFETYYNVGFGELEAEFENFVDAF